MKFISIILIVSLLLVSCNKHVHYKTTQYIGAIDSNVLKAQIILNIDDKNEILNGCIISGWPFPIEQIINLNGKSKFSCPIGVVGKALLIHYELVLIDSKIPTCKMAKIISSNFIPPLQTEIELIPAFISIQCTSTPKR